jgi:hypothetical protein
VGRCLVLFQVLQVTCHGGDSCRASSTCTCRPRAIQIADTYVARSLHSKNGGLP